MSLGIKKWSFPLDGVMVACAICGGVKSHMGAIYSDIIGIILIFKYTGGHLVVRNHALYFPYRKSRTRIAMVVLYHTLRMSLAKAVLKDRSYILRF